MTTTNKGSSFSNAFIKIIQFVLIVWVIEILNYMLGHRLSNLGIFPRTIAGLPGILLTPFLHGGLEHTAMNTVPLIVLGILISLKNHHVLFKISFFIIVFGGLGVWIFGRPAFHVGASGLIFGYFGYLVAQGWYARNFGSLVIAVITVFFYGSMFWGIFPIQVYISWEAHLFGFLAGIIAARIFSSG